MAALPLADLIRTVALFLDDPAVRAALAARHLATLSTLRADGSPHVAPVGFAVVGGKAVVLASDGTQKVRNIERSPRVVLCQVDGAFWLSVEGPAVVTRDPERISAAEAAYASRYQAPRLNPHRVAIEVTIERVLGRVA